MSAVEDIFNWFAELDIDVMDYESFDQFCISIPRQSGGPLLLRCSYGKISSAPFSIDGFYWMVQFIFWSNSYQFMLRKSFFQSVW